MPLSGDERALVLETAHLPMRWEPYGDGWGAFVGRRARPIFTDLNRRHFFDLLYIEAEKLRAKETDGHRD